MPPYMFGRVCRKLCLRRKPQAALKENCYLPTFPGNKMKHSGAASGLRETNRSVIRSSLPATPGPSSLLHPCLPDGDNGPGGCQQSHPNNRLDSFSRCPGNRLHRKFGPLRTDALLLHGSVLFSDGTCYRSLRQRITSNRKQWLESSGPGHSGRCHRLLLYP